MHLRQLVAEKPTSIESALSSVSARMTGRPPAIFTPIVALVAIAAVLLIAAWWLDDHRSILYVGAGIAWTTAGLVAMVLLHRQVLQQQTAARAVRRLEARVTDVVESARDPIITVDDDQRVVLFNAAAESVFQWPRGAVLGEPLVRLLPETPDLRQRARIETLVAVRANGEAFPVEASISQHIEDERTLVTIILRDVTERVRAESLLTRSETRLRSILDSAMDAIVTIDANQHIVLFNGAAEAMFGCPRDEATGAPLAWFIPERMRAAHGEHVRRFGESGTASRRMGALRIVTGLRRNGEEFPIDASISQVTEDGAKFYTVILRDVTARIEAEAALQRSKEELRKLGSAADVAREQDKNRIARELHDELGQALTMLQMDVAWCKEKLPEGEVAFTQRLERMAALLVGTVAATRRIASDLRPLLLDDLGLLPAVEWLVENFTQRTGVRCELVVDSVRMQLPAAHSTAVFRVVQEALTNVAKHAQAAHVEVAIEQHPTEIVIRIRDDGRGFAPHAPRRTGSFGLVGMRERALLLGGEAAIASEEGQGTTVDVRLPLTPGESAT